MRDRLSQSAAPVATAIAIGLLNAAGICDWICRIPSNASLSWPHLVLRTFLYALAAGSVYLLAVRIFCKRFGDHFESPPWPRIAYSWPCAVWMPPLVLLLKSESIFAIFLPPLIAAYATSFVAYMQSGDEAMAAEKPAHLFRMLPAPPMLQTIVPAFATSIAFESGVGTLLGGDYLFAGLLFGSCLLFPLWKLQTATPKAHEDASGEVYFRQSITIVSVAIACALTLFVLLPSINDLRMAAEMRALLKTAKAPVIHNPTINRPVGAGYSGVVLLLPPKPADRIEAPRPVSQTQAPGAKSKPLVIPFDGVYWFFKYPDDRPKADARVLHGDPIKANVRSTDRLPVLMEAHQALASSLKMDCCKAIRMEILNGDNRPGAISVEVLLRSITHKGIFSQSLGSRVLPSSVSVRQSSILSAPADRPTVDDTLTFRMPRHVHGRQFNEITVIIQPSMERSLVGARLSIQQFVLLP